MHRFFRPSDRTPLNAVNVALGLVMLLISLRGHMGAEWTIFAALGSTFVIGGVAEFLPSSQRTLSGVLRLVSMACALAVLVLTFMHYVV